jgi:AraC-like DNA-binding protein
MRIGVLAGWPLYGMDGPDLYLLDAFRGVAAAAAERGCDVLFAAGLATAARPQPHSALPYVGPNCQYVPVGAFNTDGLILIPPFFTGLTAEQMDALAHGGTPCVFLGQPGPGPSVISDTEAGLASAIAHLKSLGHTDIAFVAGHKVAPVNYSTHRLAFDEAMRQNHLRADAARVAYGLHSRPGGCAAMQTLLAQAHQTSRPFSAVIVDGDESLVGVMDALRDAGLRVPHDIAVIAYNNSLQSQTLAPPVTVIHQQTAEIGRRAAHLLIDMLTRTGKVTCADAVVRVPEQLIVRASCGARLARQQRRVSLAPRKQPGADEALLAEMTEAIRLEGGGIGDEALRDICASVVNAWRAYLKSTGDEAHVVRWLQALSTALDRSRSGLVDARAWHTALSSLLALASGSARTAARRARVSEAIHQAHVTVAQFVQQQQAQRTQARLRTTERMAVLSARLLTATSDAEIMQVATAGLQELDTQLMCIALLDGITQYDGVLLSDAPQSRLRYAAWTLDATGVTTTWREAHLFPPEHPASAEKCASLLVIPFDVDGVQAGFVAMTLEGIALGGAITQQIAGAIRSSRLYAQLAQARAEAERAKRIHPSTRALAQRALAYIHVHYAGDTTRERIAAHVGIHSDYLTYIFRRETGLTPIAYLNRFRIEQACRMIEGGKNITEVALAVGFSDLSYFSRVFRRHVGVSPNRFQQGRTMRRLPTDD